MSTACPQNKPARVRGISDIHFVAVTEAGDVNPTQRRVSPEPRQRRHLGEESADCLFDRQRLRHGMIRDPHSKEVSQSFFRPNRFSQNQTHIQAPTENSPRIDRGAPSSAESLPRRLAEYRGSESPPRGPRPPPPSPAGRWICDLFFQTEKTSWVTNESQRHFTRDGLHPRVGPTCREVPPSRFLTRIFNLRHHPTRTGKLNKDIFWAQHQR